MKVNSIVALGILLVAGLLVGCDSKPTPDTTPAPPPPAGHQNHMKGERFPTATPPSAGTPSTVQP